LNAFKSTHTGSLSINIRCLKNQKTLSGCATIVWIITDIETGIPEDQQELIFKSFQQTDSTSDKFYKNTWLSLDLSYELAKFLGGILSFQNIFPTGSILTLSLPNIKYDHPTPPVLRQKTQALHHTNQAFSRKKLLIIDNDVESIYTMAKALSDADYALEFSDNTELARYKLSKDSSSFHAVIFKTSDSPTINDKMIADIRSIDRYTKVLMIALSNKKEKTCQADTNTYFALSTNIQEILKILGLHLKKAGETNDQFSS